MSRLFEIGSFRAGDPDEERGRFFFGEDQNEELEMIGNSLLRLVLENFVFWPIMFPNSSEKVKQASSKLSENGVYFPEEVHYYKSFFK